jgi:hypothetical protein
MNNDYLGLLYQVIDLGVISSSTIDHADQLIGAKRFR